MAKQELTPQERAVMDRQVMVVIAGLAAQEVVKGRGDEMMGLPLASLPEIPGEVRQGMKREVPAINILRYVMDRYVE